MKNNSISVFLFIVGLSFAFSCTNHTSDESSVISHLRYKDSSGIKIPINTLHAWEEKRRQIIKGMERAMGKLPERRGLPAPEVAFTDSVKEENYTKYTISYPVAQSEIVTAYLYVPVRRAESQRFPAMLVLHGTGDLGKQIVDGKSPGANRALAKELAERGYVVIAPDYPSMGDAKDYDFAKDRYQSGTMKGIFNHIRSVDLLEARQDVDPERIGVIGHSLGGHNAMFVAAFDPRLKVIVSSCGWTLMDYYDIGEQAAKRYGGRLGPWAQDRYMPLLRDEFELDAEKIPFDFDEVIAALAPRPFFSNSPLNDGNFNVEGVREGIASASEVYELFDAEANLQVHYPDAAHDFPPEIRLRAYRFVDEIFAHTPNQQEIK
jgi:dienelactone hydrolase